MFELCIHWSVMITYVLRERQSINLIFFSFIPVCGILRNTKPPLHFHPLGITFLVETHLLNSLIIESMPLWLVVGPEIFATEQQNPGDTCISWSIILYVVLSLIWKFPIAFEFRPRLREICLPLANLLNDKENTGRKSCWKEKAKKASNKGREECQKWESKNRKRCVREWIILSNLYCL